MFRTRRSKITAVVVGVALLWIAAVTVMISQQPDIGVKTPMELQEKFQDALNSGDSRKLEELIDYPPSDAGEFSQAYISELKDRGAHLITVEMKPDNVAPRFAEIKGMLIDGSHFSYNVNIRARGDGWRIELTPPI